MSIQSTLTMESSATDPVREESWVDRRSGLTANEFIKRYRNPRKPVIMNDVTRPWPIHDLASPDYFRTHYGDQRVRVKGRDYALRELMDLLEASTLEHPAPYPCKFEIAADLPPLLKDVLPRFPHSLPERQTNALMPKKLYAYVNNLEIFFGGPGGKFPYLHFDVLHMHAWINQMYGHKEFTLYPPDQKHLLYVQPEMPWQSSIENHQDPDYTRYPLLRQARKQSVVLNPGDTLFVPCGWWHTARSLDVTISIAFDQLAGDNWRNFRHDLCAEQRRRGHGALSVGLLNAYLMTLGGCFGLAEKFGANRNAHWNRS
ncbi:MAG: cupin-like domain-containing protein [Dokdonella sp.]